MATAQKLKIENVGLFDLAQTFDCGQCFRWNPNEDGSYTGVLHGRVITIWRSGDDLEVEGVDERELQELLIPYLALDEDYEELQRLFHQSEILGSAVDYASGIRVLRQDSWEALCSFIISQNNNIKRIKGIVENLCRSFGDDLGGGYYSFPSAERLAGLTVEDLAPLRSGFRAKYILDAAQRVSDGRIDLDEIRSMDIASAENKLMEIKGVGIKVAHCALLYGFHRIECLPVDVWMKRAMAVMFPDGLPENMLPYAGIAQQYIFHYSRNHPELFK